MANLADRHIRKDWPEFNDRQDQRTITALCGRRTRPYLAGIPTVTQQEPVVRDKSGRVALGWCIECCKAATIIDTSHAPGEIRQMHRDFFTVVSALVQAWNTHVGK